MEKIFKLKNKVVVLEGTYKGTIGYVSSILRRGNEPFVFVMPYVGLTNVSDFGFSDPNHCEHLFPTKY